MENLEFCLIASSLWLSSGISLQHGGTLMGDYTPHSVTIPITEPWTYISHAHQLAAQDGRNPAVLERHHCPLLSLFAWKEIENFFNHVTNFTIYPWGSEKKFVLFLHCRAIF
ncbi:hypothetical protein TNCV_1007701 [Trichonephila clavipes]|nr:hypothetical protein TNCV_1007701 [Trichonephila clavipes]